MKSFQDIKEGYLKKTESDEENEVSEEENFETDTVAVSIKPITTSNTMNAREMFEHLDNQKKKPEKKEKSSTMNFGDDDEEEEDEEAEKSKAVEDHPTISSKRDLNKILKQTAKKFMKKSKVVQKKNLANHKKNVKQSQRKKFKIEKKLKKHKKLKK